MALTLILFCLGAQFALAAIAVAIGQYRHAGTLVYAFTLVNASVALIAAGHALLGGKLPVADTLPVGLPWLGTHLRIDAVSAFFLVVVNFGVAAASLFALGYARHEQSPQRVLPFYAAFVAAMNLVIVADDAFVFLLSWELMSLASWALVVSHHRDNDNIRAGYVYLLMASFGTMALLLAFGALAGPQGAFDFAAMRAAHPTPGLTALVLILVLLGAGSKAGLLPLHVWLPLAHPAAPSHVSALMSGVMTKVAIYALIRILFDLMGEPAWWWSLVLLFTGGISAVMGALYALLQRDLKRILAYSTIENIGVITCGIGLALAFKAENMAWAAALALTAALLHVLNHSLFKSLLFFGAGAVLTATGERNIERLGGLIHRMPRTSFVVLVGSVAISALPPFNGFVSEWLTFQAILLSPQLPSWALRLMVPATGAMLALSAALAAACFVRAYGVTFLGRPRSDAAQAAKETDAFSLTAMFALSALCLLIGILPGLFIDALSPVALQLFGQKMPQQLGVDWLSIVPIAESRSSYNGILLFLFMVISGTLAASVIHRFASDRLRRGPAWDCGFPDAHPATQYSAASLGQPLRRVYASLLFRARETIDMPAPGDMRPARFTLSLHDVIWDALYAPIAGTINWIADQTNRTRFFTIRQFLSLVFAALIILLGIVALWR
jgi:formate hydrogenlyase subunit 3/multisubunit Na+/H+ antiporter MnhD subunit